MQVVNANKAISSLEVSTDGGYSWQGTSRQSYNFFENGGLAYPISGPVDVRVTSVDGDQIVVGGVDAAQSGALFSGPGNF